MISRAANKASYVYVKTLQSAVPHVLTDDLYAAAFKQSNQKYVLLISLAE